MRMSWLFGRKTAQRAPSIMALLILAGALFLRAVDPGPLQNLRSVAFDSFQQIQPREYLPDTPVRIVDIDEAALAAHGRPGTVVTDRAAALAHVIAELTPAVKHNAEQYANNRIECDHGSLKARLRPMRGMKTNQTASVIIRGRAFIQNIR